MKSIRLTAANRTFRLDRNLRGGPGLTGMREGLRDKKGEKKGKKKGQKKVRLKVISLSLSLALSLPAGTRDSDARRLLPP